MVPIIVPIPGKATRARWAAKVRTRLGPGAGAARGAELPRRLGGGVAADGRGAHKHFANRNDVNEQGWPRALR